MRAAVPLGAGPLRPGLLRALDVPAPEGVRLKNISWPLETAPLVDAALLDLLVAVAERYGMDVGRAAATMLPFLKDMNVRLRRLEKPLAGNGEMLPGLCRGRGGAAMSLKQICQSPQAVKKELAQELVSGRARMLAPRRDAAAGERCLLACEAPWPVRPNALRQIKCLETLMLQGAVNRRSLIRSLGSGGASVVDALVSQGLVRLESDDDDARQEQLNVMLLEPVSAVPVSLTLTDAQQAAVDALVPLLDTGKTAQRLLYGVTGSGKTVVYTEVIKACLARGRSALLLAPEVALAHKLKRDLQNALPDARLVFYHGYQSQHRREITFRAMNAVKGPRLVIGTRSALFLPVPDLGCVILDEEHDQAFKQEERVPYQAKEAAWFKARRAGALMLLGSATPDIKTWHASCRGVLPALRLPGRVSGSQLPPVELVPMARTRFAEETGTLLASATLEALDQVVGRGEQAIVLLNRRGFAPQIYCPDCKNTLSCPNCSVGLSFHRDLGRLLCHYCGHSIDFPAPCPACGHMNFLPMGEGTERVTSFLTARYGREVLRFDRDSTRRAGAMEELLTRFADHEAQVLVGTQMVSKGHHFPDVTLAVIADGDLGLSLPDYRAAERTFQLLVQSAGRAGRGAKPGRVLIQTRDTRHYCWQYVINADYEGFYAAEIERRRRFCFPPFSHLTLIRFTYEREDADAASAMEEMRQWIKNAARERGLTLLGPVPSPIPMLNNRMRFQCLLKTTDWAAPRRLYHDACLRKEARKMRVILDLDPVSML